MNKAHFGLALGALIDHVIRKAGNGGPYSSHYFIMFISGELKVNECPKCFKM